MEGIGFDAYALLKPLLNCHRIRHALSIDIRAGKVKHLFTNGSLRFPCTPAQFEQWLCATGRRFSAGKPVGSRFERGPSLGCRCPIVVGWRRPCLARACRGYVGLFALVSNAFNEVAFCCATGRRFSAEKPVGSRSSF